MVDKTPPKEMYEFIVDRSIPDHLEYIKKGDLSSKGSLYTRYRTLAVLEWHLHKDKAKYHQHLKTALAYERERFTEVHQNNPNQWLYHPLGEAMTALCVGDFAYAKEYITFLDDNTDHQYKSYEPWLYYIFVMLVLGRYEDKRENYMAKLMKSYSSKKYSPLLPRVAMLEAIFEKNEQKFCVSLKAFMVCHKPSGIYYGDYEDRFLAMSTLSICQIAIGLGMKIDFDHPFVPRALLGV